jgi:uncharacterized protein (TIGR02594 family)
MDPIWIKNARQYIGQKEVSGVQSNSWILSLWQPIPWIWATVTRKDDTLLPWCGAFVRFVLVLCGIKPPKEWYRARGFIGFGVPMTEPVVGAIGVIKNSKGQFHVGFVLGADHAGNIILLGGNQNDQVKLSAFKKSAFVAYSWPDANIAPIPAAGPLPILSAALSTSEA